MVVSISRIHHRWPAEAVADFIVAIVFRPQPYLRFGKLVGFIVCVAPIGIVDVIGVVLYSLLAVTHLVMNGIANGYDIRRAVVVIDIFPSAGVYNNRGVSLVFPRLSC